MLENLFKNYSEIIEYFPWINTLIGVTSLLLAVLLINIILKKVLLKVINNALSSTVYGKDKELNNTRIIIRFINIIPIIVIMESIDLIPGIAALATAIVVKLCKAYIIYIFAMTINSALSIVNILYKRIPDASNHSIKGYIQLVKILISIISAILIISILLDRSPLILLSGIGAIAAVLMLIFQDTILSLVASIQISSSDMLRIGDWISAPNLNADGTVIDIALHTVKVQNFDKTITTLPTRKLITDPFKNWRGMQESGARRIKRAINFDQNSIRYLSEKEIEHLKSLDLLEDYLIEKSQEITSWNDRFEKDKSSINNRKLTNMGTFRAYVSRYLRTHPGIHQQMTLLVRQLDPTSEGLPLEIYCFTNSTVWDEYEGIQSDIFEHLFTISSEFGLNIFQIPTGADIITYNTGQLKQKNI
jgi:miniconductance mechanosensitive channel